MSLGASNVGVSSDNESDTNDNCYASDGSASSQDDCCSDGKKATIIVVGLYIGISLSGSAFIYKNHGKWCNIQMNKSWINGNNIATTTIPTAVAWTKRNRKTIDDFKFGHEAIISYTRAAHSKDFIILEGNDIDFKTNGDDGSVMSAATFLQIVISKLKDNIMMQLDNRNLRADNRDVHIKWIVACATAMQSYLSSDFLNKVIRSRNIDTLPEDLAAAVWCAEMPMYALTNNEDKSLPPQTHFCVIDVESQYVSVFEKKGNMKVKRLATQLCSLNLPEKYHLLFCEVFEQNSKKRITGHKRDHPRDWLVLLKDMQTHIDGLVYSETMQIIISLPHSFVTYFAHVPKYDSKSVKFTGEGKLMIKPAYFHAIFDACASQILFFLNGLNNATFFPIDFLFLIGKATFLQRHIRKCIDEKPCNQKTFPRVIIQDIKEPEDSGACALKGAVMYGRALSYHL